MDKVVFNNAIQLNFHLMDLKNIQVEFFMCFNSLLTSATKFALTSIERYKSSTFIRSITLEEPPTIF